MSLDEVQKQKVKSWIEQGLSLSEIQNKLASESGVQMTYMEVRFLIDDLKLKPKDKERPKSPPAEIKSAVKGTGAEPAAQGKGIPATAAAAEATTGNISVSVDQVAKPGSLASGKVTFSDGNAADWYLDQYGRLGLAPKKTGYKPSEPDLANFQAELQNELAKLGF
jgi:hypothetical protein